MVEKGPGYTFIHCFNICLSSIYYLAGYRHTEGNKTKKIPCLHRAHILEN